MSIRNQLVVISLTALAGVTPPVMAQADSSAASRNREILAQVDSFFAHPFSRSLGRAVLTAASDRADVMVSLQPGLMPWMCYDDRPAELKTLNGILTLGYLAGDMRSQLQSGKKGDDPQAALRGILAAYSSIQLRVPNYSVPEIERWKQATENGQMARLADSLVQHPPRSCTKRPLRLTGPVTLSPSDTL